MNKKAMLLILLALTGMVFMSACVEQSPIKNKDDVGKAVGDVSSSVDKVSDILSDVDNTLGGT